MPRVRLRHPEQPYFLQGILVIVEFLASLRLAVLLLTLLIFVLAVATFLETTYGAEVARFAVYHAWWFPGLGALLALNVLFAALVRFPWRKHQIGFVMTHAGIIILLLGSLATARHGIDAQLSIYEGQIGHIAFKDTFHFEIIIEKDRQQSSLDAPDTIGTGDRRQSETRDNTPVRVSIPFRGGPFNWCDYSTSLRDLLWSAPGKLPILPWQLARRDHGVVFADGNFRLEVLDYYADSRRVKGGYLAGYLRAVTSESRNSSWLAPWQPIELELHTARGRDQEAAVIGTRTSLTDGTRIVLLGAPTQTELDGFLLGTPVSPLDDEGQVVLVHNRVRYVLPVRELRGHKEEIPLKGSELWVTHFEVDTRLQAVQLQLKNREGVEDDLILFADLPEFNRQSRKLGVSGAYWVDFGKVISNPEKAARLNPRATAGALRARIDLCQGPDNQLYYRVWKSPELLGSGKMRLDNRPCILQAGQAMNLRLMVNTFVPWSAEAPDADTIAPLPFGKGARIREPRVKVRLSAGSKSLETWLAVIPRGASDPVAAEEMAIIEDEARQVRVSIKYDSVDVGFRLKLLEFQRKLDPGTNQPSYYASLVDLYVPERFAKNPITVGPELQNDTIVDSSDNERLRLVHPKVLITLNHPANIVDPVTGRSYRLYQESFSGPFRPGHPVYEQIMGSRNGRPELYASTLSVNYDPGRGLKYLGSLLVVGGVIVIYLMRAYIFRLPVKNLGPGVGPEKLKVTPLAHSTVKPQPPTFGPPERCGGQS
ncbi:MAG: hypothetical protein ACUVQG_11240 [Thermogutta sp.]